MTTESFSKSEIDRLGERLKRGDPSDADLRMLDAYRRAFGDAYEFVVATIRDRLRVKPTGRPAKSTTSVIEKLQRETVRLSQMQDIAGCRVVARNIVEQNRLLARVKKLFPNCTFADRRQRPSHGYRAVHVIVHVADRPIEIQVRSKLQHVWAEVSERLSDSVGIALKYGRGPKRLQDELLGAADIVAKLEEQEVSYAKVSKTLGRGNPQVRRNAATLRRARTRTVKHLEEISKLSDTIELSE
jgi:ppGpp synthetase/RelA/SpoT-type nucleotidyltranferase